MLSEYMENRYEAGFRAVGADLHDPLCLSGWYCIAQWFCEGTAGRDRPVSPQDIPFLLGHDSIQRILPLCGLNRFPIAQQAQGLAELIGMLQEENLTGINARLFYQDYLCCAVTDMSCLTGRRGVFGTGAMLCSLIHLCMVYAGDRLGTPRIFDLLATEVYFTHQAEMDQLGISHDAFEQCWNAVHFCDSSTPARPRPKVAESVRVYQRFHAPNRLLLEQYALTSGLDPKKIRASGSPLEYIREQTSGRELPENGLSDQEKAFLDAAYQISRERPTDVVQTIFYQQRDDSRLECMIARTELRRIQSMVNDCLIVNPSPMFLVEYSRYEEEKRSFLQGACQTTFAVMDDLLCSLYHRQFPQFRFIPIRDLEALSERFDCLVIFARDYEKRDDLWKALGLCALGGQVIVVIPQTAFTQKDETFMEAWLRYGCGIRYVLDVPEKLCCSSPRKKAVIAGQRGCGCSKTFRLLSGATDDRGDWFVLSKQQDLVPPEWLCRRMTLAQIRRKIRDPVIPTPRVIRSYPFSKEISMEYTLLERDGKMEAARASYRTIYRPGIHRQASKGKRIVRNYERGLRAQSLSELYPKLELAALSDLFSPQIVHDVMDYYQEDLSRLSIKSMWYCCREELSCRLSYDEELAKELFCGEFRGLSDLESGSCTPEEIAAALSEQFGTDEIPHRIWLQLNLYFQTAMELKLVVHNPVSTFLAVSKNRQKDRLYMLNAALKKSCFTEAEEQRIVAFLREPIVCKRGRPMERCSTSDLSRSAQKMFAEIGMRRDTLIALNQELMAAAQTAREELEEDEFREIESDPTAYLLRRNFATHLAKLCLTDAEIWYVIGHKIEDPYVRRRAFNDEKMLWALKQKLDERPLLNPVIPVRSIRLETGRSTQLTGSKKIRMEIPVNGMGKAVIRITANEPGDTVNISVIPQLTGGTVSCEFTSHGVPLPEKPARTIDGTRAYLESYQNREHKEET